MFLLSKMSKRERTLIIFKPDAVSRGVVGQILSRFEQVGLKIVGTKMLKPDRDFFYHHYETIGTMISRRGEKTFEVNLKAMQKSPVIAMVLEGVGAVMLVRKMVWGTESYAAAPGTIRGDFSHMSLTYADQKGIGVPNVIHASGDVDEAALEIKHWFKEEELFDYKRADESFMS